MPVLQGKSGNNHDVSIASPSPSASASQSPSQSPIQHFAASMPAFHTGEVGLAYTPLTPAATGGTPPYHWALSGGSLPPGLALGGDGTVAGKPTSAGTFPFSIEATDSGSGKASLTGSITVAPAVNASLVSACAKYCHVELGCTNACGNFGQVTGGVAPFTTQLIQGQLPAGTSLSGLSLLGTFAGQTGYLQFSVQLTDSLGATGTVSPTFWMYKHVVLTGGTVPAGPNGVCYWPGAGPYDLGCTAQFPFAGGTPSAGTPSDSTAWVRYAWNGNPTGCTTPPPTPAITVGNGVVTVSVPHAVGCGTSGYTGTLAITLTNQDVCSAGPAKCSATADVTITQQSG